MSGRRVSRPVAIGLAVLVCAAVAQLGLQWHNRTDRIRPGVDVAVDRPDFDYVVPAGTAARIEAGEKLSVMPSVLRASVGDVIRIRNDDDKPADVGPFRVPAGSTLTQKLTRTGTFLGFCVLSPTGQSKLIVSRS